MEKFFYQHPIARKAGVSLLIVIVYLTGRYIPLPFLNLDSYGLLKNSSLTLTAHLTGGDLSQIGLFSLGLSPWMYANIMTGLFSLGQKGKGTAPRIRDYRKNTLMLVIALIQALGLAISLDYGTESKADMLALIGMVSLILVSGAFIVSWLVSLNTSYGFAGGSLLVLVSILISQFRLLPQLGDLLQTDSGFYVWGLLCWSLLAIYLTVLLEKAEYRIPVQRISIKNSLTKDAYMPVKLNLTGGMPFMYATTLLTFPNYLLALLAFLFPQKADTIMASSRFFSNLTLEGTLVYMVCLFLLSLGFAFMALNPTDKARELRKSGDYIPDQRPGRPSRSYLAAIVWRLAVFNGLFLIAMGGLPLLLAVNITDLQPLVGFPGVVLMTVGILLSIISEVDIMRLRKDYEDLFQ